MSRLIKKWLTPKGLNDKQTHALYGSGVFLILWLLLNIHVAIFFTLVIAIAVELYDGLTGEGFTEYKDVFATILIPSAIYLVYVLLLV